MSADYQQKYKKPLANDMRHKSGHHHHQPVMSKHHPGPSAPPDTSMQGGVENSIDTTSQMIANTPVVLTPQPMGLLPKQWVVPEIGGHQASITEALESALFRMDAGNSSHMSGTALNLQYSNFMHSLTGGAPINLRQAGGNQPPSEYTSTMMFGTGSPLSSTGMIHRVSAFQPIHQPTAARPKPTVANRGKVNIIPSGGVLLGKSIGRPSH
jgi:hypothetical protein